jgi:ribosomal-protein-serine acetyltransferase
VRHTGPVLPYELPGGCMLRLFAEADADELASVVVANRAYLAEWLPWVPASGPPPTIEFIRTTLRQVEANDGFTGAIVDGGQIIGTIGFHHVDWNHRATSIGYWLAENRQGRGTMTEAVTALSAHALEVWRLNRIEIRVAVGNARSAAIPERLGFTLEGILRESERHGDQFKDLRVYSLLAADWASRPS